MAKPINFRVLAFDPGGSTGYAWMQCIKYLNSDTGQWDYIDARYDCGVLGPDKHHSELEELMWANWYEADEIHIVAETFEYRNKSRAGLNLMAREYIGIITLFGERHDDVTSSFQSPAQAKGFVTNDALKKLGVYKTGKDDLQREYKHAMDAYRHLFYYLIFGAKILPEVFLAKGWKSA